MKWRHDSDSLRTVLQKRWIFGSQYPRKSFLFLDIFQYDKLEQSGWKSNSNYENNIAISLTSMEKYFVHNSTFIIKIVVQ